MLRKCLVMCFLSMGALALVSGIAAAQTGGDGGYFAADNCYYVPYNGQWLRKGCQWTQGGHTLFRNDLEGGVLYVWVQTAYGPQWMPGGPISNAAPGPAASPAARPSPVSAHHYRWPPQSNLPPELDQMSRRPADTNFENWAR
jgi:hypothetical protein